MRRLVGVVASVALLLVGLLSFPSTAVALPAERGTQAGFAHDVQLHTAVISADVTERGPPSPRPSADMMTAVDRWSGGGATRSSEPTPHVSTTYDAPAEFVQVARATGTTGEHTQGDDRAVTSLGRSGVAANGGDTLLSAGGGAARLPMNMGTVRDVASKYGIPIDDLSIKINRSIAGRRGSTAPNGCVTLCRGAFESEEQLAKTLVHERVHVEDLRAGMPYPSGYSAASAAEIRAEAIANAWWRSLP